MCTLKIEFITQQHTGDVMVDNITFYNCWVSHVLLTMYCC